MNYTLCSSLIFSRVSDLYLQFLMLCFDFADSGDKLLQLALNTKVKPTLESDLKDKRHSFGKEVPLYPVECFMMMIITKLIT